MYEVSSAYADKIRQGGIETIKSVLADVMTDYHDLRDFESGTLQMGAQYFFGREEIWIFVHDYCKNLPSNMKNLIKTPKIRQTIKTLIGPLADWIGLDCL